MQLEAGKYYRTRDGRKAYVVGSDPFNPSEPFPFVGWIAGCGLRTWTASGAWANFQSDCDLVAPWKEPETETMVLALYRAMNGHNICSSFYGGPEAARRVIAGAGGELLALKEVTITEGEGV
jgi:hypothetical protein